MKPSRTTAAVIAALSTTFLLAGCNMGGETTCKDYSEKSATERDDVIEKWLKDKNDAEPTSQDVAIAKPLMDVYCSAHPDQKINDVEDIGQDIGNQINKGLNDLQNGLNSLIPQPPR